MRSFILIAVVAVCLLAPVHATLGIDISELIPVDKAQCLLQNNQTFAVVRAWRSYGAFDPSVVQSIANLKTAGFKTIDVYMFPCFKCGNPAGQVNKTLDGLASAGARFGTLWLDIEGSGVYWGSDLKANAVFVDAMRAAALARGQKVGVYTSYYQWIEIVGQYSGCSSLPLWFALYDDQPSFKGFKAMGGWTTPTIKQFQGDKTMCRFGVDLNWKP